MAIYNLKRNNLIIICTILFVQLFTSCKKNEETPQEPPAATIENLEIGYGNNGQGIIGRDFHLDMDVIAGERIENIEVLIKQKAGVTYSKVWSFSLVWNEFKGVKNTNVHKHFDIDKDAPQGEYDFIIRVKDENGSLLEKVETIKLVSAENLQADPMLYSFMLEKVDKGYLYILNRGFMIPGDNGFKKGEKMKSYIDISKVKDDGEIYALLIKKSANHLPETVGDIDFNKVIVTDRREHTGMKEVDYFTNYVGMPDFSPKEFEIGASVDNNMPAPKSIQNEKAWQNGKYYLGVVYTNKTHNMSAHYYIEVDIAGF